MTFIETVTLEKLSCGKCGGVFALNQRFVEHARLNKGGYSCPYCRIEWSWGESEADRLRKELTAQKCEVLKRQQLLEIETKAKAECELKLKRLTNRVCPCCSRSFINLKRHMAAKHPEIKKSQTLTVK